MNAPSPRILHAQATGAFERALTPIQRETAMIDAIRKACEPDISDTLAQWAAEDESIEREYAQQWNSWADRFGGERIEGVE